MIKRLKKLNPYVLLSLLVLASCLVIYVLFIFKNNFFVFADIGSDTREQYIMWYSSIADKLRSGTFSFWDFRNGFGASIVTQNIYDPFQILICLFGVAFGSARIAHVLIYVNILKIVLSSVFMYYFLNLFNLSKASKLIASYMYAFNGFIIVWGQHYSFATISVLLPLLFAAVEQTLHNKNRGYFVTLVTFVIAVYSMYFCYMALLTVGVYYVIRLLQFDINVKEKLKIFARETLMILLGLGMACFAFLPDAYVTLNVSGRIAGNSTLLNRLIASFTLYPQQYYKTFLYRMFSSNFQGTSIFTGYFNYYEALNFCCSNLLIFLLLQYIFSIHKQNVSKKQKIIQYGIIILIAFAFFVQTGGLVYNAFCYTITRWTFVVIPVLIMVAAKTFDKILKTKKINVPALAVYAVLFVAVYLKARRGIDPQFIKGHIWVLILNLWILFAVGILMAVVAILFSKGKIKQQMFCILMLLLVCVNLMSDSFVSANYRTVEKKNSSYISTLYNKDIHDAMTYLRQSDDDFFRTEKTFYEPTFNTDALAQGYYGISTYNSLINKNILKFKNDIWPNIIWNDFIYQNNFMKAKNDRLKASLVDIKYVLSKNKNELLNGFTKIKEFGNIAVLKNDLPVALGRLYTKCITQEQFAGRKDSMNIDNLLADAVIVERVGAPKVTQVNPDDYTNKEADESKLIGFGNMALADFKVGRNESRLTGSINASEDGILFVAVPYEGGWTAYVDGQKMQMQKADYGFCGIDITAGEHKIEMKFVPPWLKLGAAISLISLLIFIILLILKKQRKAVDTKHD